MSEVERVEALVERLSMALEAVDWMGRKVRPTLRPPANAAAIAELESSLGRALPASYKRFLSLHDGMEGGDQYDWIIAGATEVEVGESIGDAKAGHLYAYKQKASDHPVLLELEGALVVGTDFDYQIAYFLDGKADELSIRRVSLDQDWGHYKPFPTFCDFLDSVVGVYEDMVAMQVDQERMSDGAELAQVDDQLLAELAMLLGGKTEEEPEEEAQVSDEVRLAMHLCTIMLDKLVEAELIELAGSRVHLEESLLNLLLKSRSPGDTIKSWIRLLSKAAEVEELYGTDEELNDVMMSAFEEISS